MDKLLLTIKGAPEVAIRAAHAQGANLTNVRKIEMGSSLYTQGEVTMDLQTAVNWLCADREPPFPDGSLLLYKFLDE